jgi:hypothetical protein
MARPGKSIAKQSEGRAGEKCLPVGGRVRKLRAVGDQSGPPSREQMEEPWSLNARSEGRSGCFPFVGPVKYQWDTDPVIL